jgi:hypothetical protein
MHHEEQRDAMEVIGTASRQVVEAAAKPANEVEALEELLIDDDASEGRELLIFEPELGYAAR